MLNHAKSIAGELAFGSLMAAKALRAPVALGAHAMLVDRSGKVLLARHSYMKGWSLPGGGVARGEPPVDALLRELREEIGQVRSEAPQLVGIYSRRSGWATNVIVLYRLANAEVEFRPNFEVREILFADPRDPPAGTLSGTQRRPAEFTGKAPPSLTW